MIISAPFIVRPVATTLLTLAVVLAGLLSFFLLPVAPLPQVDIPTISVSASLPGASPETMASSVATPLERSLGSIAGVTEMTSSSSQGSTRVTLQFDLSRDINGAARDVQAAINAARSLLPTSLRSNPTYHKSNPSDAPIMTLALTSDTLSQGQLYDLASTIVAQKLSQVDGVGEVTVGGSSLPAVRVTVLPGALANRGVSLDDVRTALANANANRPKGVLENDRYHWQVMVNDQLSRAEQYKPLIVAWRDGAPVRVSDVAKVEDSVEDLYQTGFFNDRKAILMILRRQADANIIETVDAVRAQLPMLSALMPADVKMSVAQDRTPSIRASLHEAELTLVIAVGLVVLVVLLFLRRWRAALIPSVAVPVSLIGTFCVMYLCGYTLNTISLMALIVATGFVVDDAIVVLENIMRHVERGMTPMRAALRGSREVGFTVLSMSLSLVAVFIPILLMGGVVGRLFREFAVTLSAAIAVSLVVSLTLTPMMCARLLRAEPAEPRPPGRLARWSERGFVAMQDGYRRTLGWALAHGRLMMLILAAAVGLNVYLYAVVPKGFFPQQDTGQLLGFFRVDQGTSFQATVPKLDALRKVVLADPAVQSMTGFAGGRGGSNSSFMQIQLKPLQERGVSADVVINRLRGKLQNMPGARMFLVAQQDIRIGGRSSQGSYDYTLMSGDLQLLRTWMPKVQRAMAEVPEITDVDTDVEDKAPDQPGDRPRGRHPARRQHEHHLHRAQQFLQPAPGIGDVRPAQPISRGDGRGPALRAGYRVAQAGGSDHRHRRARAHVGLRPLRGCQCAVERAAPGAVRGRHRVVQPGAGRVSGPGHGGHRRGGGAHRAAVGSDPGGLPGYRRRPAADAGAAALADPGRPGHHVYRAGHPVRELRAPADHSVDAAIRRPGRAAGPADAAPGLHADRADRRVPADRHRQEKRHHDGGLRAGGRAHAGWRRATRSSRPA